MQKPLKASDHRGPNQPLSLGLRALALSNGTHGGRREQGGVWVAVAAGGWECKHERPQGTALAAFHYPGAQEEGAPCDIDD